MLKKKFLVIETLCTVFLLTLIINFNAFGQDKNTGASVSGLVVKISTSFVKLSLIAFCLGCPVAYLAMDKFLSGYSYHTTLGWEVFIITGFLVIIITLIIVVYQVIKAARVNPVEVLRNE